MCETEIKSENGSMLLIALFVIFFFGSFGIIITSFVLSETQMDYLFAEERKAFYSAQSGLEYGIKRFLTSDVTNLKDWRETIRTGNKNFCEVRLHLLKDDRVEILATGHSQKYLKKLHIRLDYIDVSKYSIYSSKPVSGVRVRNPKFIYDQAPVMPIFEEDSLITLAKPFGYYPHNCKVTSAFTFPSSGFAFIEKKLKFAGEFTAQGYFVTRDNVAVIGSQPLTNVKNVIYQPNEKSFFRVKKLKKKHHVFRGGIITNGSFKGGEMVVEHDRRIIIGFMKKSLNGGPLLIKKSVWQEILQ